MEAFFLVPANRTFAEGKGPYQPHDLAPSVQISRLLSKILLVAGALATLIAAIVYLHQYVQHEQLLTSVKTVTAQVSGCEDPWQFQHVRFRYTVEGKVYDQSAYSQKPEFLWPSTLPDACKTNTVELNYLTSDPNRWSVSTISPLTGAERDAKPNGNLFIAGAIILSLSGVFAFASVIYRNQLARQNALKATGIVLKGQLLRMDEDTSQESPYPLVCYYRFKTPIGDLLDGKSMPYEKYLKEENYPPPGTPIYVVYSSDQIFDML